MATYKFAGHTYTLRDPQQVGLKSMRKLLAARDNPDPVAQLDAADTMLRMMLGPDQYEHIDSLDEEVTMKHLDEMAAIWEKAGGGAVPKSAGSSPRSKTTKVR